MKQENWAKQAMVELVTTVADLLLWSRDLVPIASDPTSYHREFRVLLADVMGLPVTRLLAWPETGVTFEQKKIFEELLQRRLAGEPLSRILGQREFWGMAFFLSSDTLDPRPDSETLVEAVLALVPDRSAPLRILDLGTGTGCLLLALLHELPFSSGIGVDISEGAVLAARRNAQHHNLHGRSHFLQGDWGNSLSLDESFDWIISNPPYIPTQEIQTLSIEVREHDPLRALDGGVHGLDCYHKLAMCCPSLLRPNGYLALEFGKGQEKSVENIMTRSNLSNHTWCLDLAGIVRCGIFQHGAPEKTGPR